MGLKQDVLDFIFKCINSNFESYSGLEMLELGNQQIKIGGQRQLAKDYFENLGFKHTSLDINGKDGAIPIDLSKLIKDRIYYNRFDVVTNSGTSEHVEPYEGQYECFGNIHLCTKVGGIMIHVIPEEGSFPGHCPFYYTLDFFEKLVKYNGYKIIEIGRLHRGENSFIKAGLIKAVDSAFCDNKTELLRDIINRPCKRVSAAKPRIYKSLVSIGKLFFRESKNE